MKQSPIAKKLLAHGRPMVTIKEMAGAFDITYAALWTRLKNVPEKEQPPMLRCGGQLMAVTENAIEWCEKHAAWWAARQEAKQ